MIDRMGRIPVEIAKTNRGPSINAYTRQHSKSIMNFYNIPKICVVCGYSKYVEICHIDPISGFSGETPLEIVNALSNLVHLCPNHHKEFDRNLISQDEKEIIVKGSKHLYNIEV
jgi:predicted restriction endonuclease